IVGEASEVADAELLCVAVDIMRELGLTHEDVRARVSDRRLLAGVLEALGVTAEQRPTVFAVFDKIARQPREVSAQKLADAGVAAQTVERVLALASGTTFAALQQEFGEAPAAREAIARFAKYLEHCTALGIGAWVTLDLSIVRGLAYYTGVVFELFDAKGELRAICGGGRYDTLLATLGGADLPALGFGLGDVVLGELLRDRGLMPARQHGADVWVVAAEGTEPHDVLGLVGYLRNETFSVDYVLNEEKLRTQRTGAQLKAAQKSGARSSAILHPDGRVELREMRAGGAEPLVLDRESLAAELRKRVPGAIDGSATISTATSNE